MSLLRLSLRLYQRPGYAVVIGKEVRMTQCCVCDLHFLAFRAILKLKLVDPKITQQLLSTTPSHIGDFAAKLDGC